MVSVLWSVQEWSEQQHYRFACVREGHDSNQRLGIVEQLLHDFGSGEHGKVMLDASDVRRAICSLVVPGVTLACSTISLADRSPCVAACDSPHPGNVRPDLTVTQISLFNGHSIPSQIPEALNPCLGEERNRLQE